MGIPDSVMPHVRRFGFSGLAAVALVVVMLLGVNPITLLSGKVAPPPAITAQTGPAAIKAGTATTGDYLQTVATEANTLWTNVFYIASVQYIKAPLIGVATSREFGCGMAGSSVGTFYCPEDGTIYVDMSSYDGLRASSPDVADHAQAYRVARSYGHHVQQTLGLLEAFAKSRDGMDEAEQIRHEKQLSAQADCYAGIWASTVGLVGMLDNPALVTAIDASSAGQPVVRIPSRQGLEVPETFAEADSASRKEWFDKGYAIPAGGTCTLTKIPLPA
ncbi:neutral zinc metallopeptidase [Devosia sp.]|uniref:neutral zinc metallopeptidase n=1 Tax=Devosia sp. TaxID=1871048 RepID=UPI0032679017